MLRNTLRLNFCNLKIIHVLHPHYHKKIIWHTLKNKQKNMYVSIHKIIRVWRSPLIQVIIMKMKIKKKIGSHRYDINRPKSRHGQKYSKYKKCLIMMMLLCINQHLSNIWSWIHEKFKQHLGWVEKKVLLIKKKHVTIFAKKLHRICSTAF